MATAADTAYNKSESMGGMAVDMVMPEVDYEYSYGYDNGYYAEDVKRPIEVVLPNSGANNGDYSEKIIKNVSVNAQTKEYDKAIKSVLEAVKQHGGFEQSVSSSGIGYNSSEYYTRSARMTVRIPAENLDIELTSVPSRSNIAIFFILYHPFICLKQLTTSASIDYNE